MDFAKAQSFDTYSFRHAVLKGDPNETFAIIGDGISNALALKNVDAGVATAQKLDMFFLLPCSPESRPS